MLMKVGADFSVAQLFLGRISGCIGGTCAPAVLLGGAYILWKKAANYRIVLAGVLGFFIVQSGLWLGGCAKAADPVRAMLAGSLLIGIFFYATDPVSAAKTNAGRWIYGAFIGVMSSLISAFSAWPAGTMFSILLANMFAPITDVAVRAWQKRGQA
jgi:Na+-transporting NADH:ubiquinone oxidoreductase subunit B